MVGLLQTPCTLKPTARNVRNKPARESLLYRLSTLSFRLPSATRNQASCFCSPRKFPSTPGM